MGLIRATLESARSTASDQYAEFIRLGNIAKDVVVARGFSESTNPDGKERKTKGHTTGAISDGTRVVVPEGFAFLVIEDGAIKDIVMEPGDYYWNTGAAPSVFNEQRGFFKGIVDAFREFGDRVKFGGQYAHEQLPIYIRLTEIMDNKFGTSNPMPYNDSRYGNIYLSTYGTFTFRIINPILLLANVISTNIQNTLTVDDIFVGQLRNEFVMNIISTMSSVGNAEQLPFDQFVAKSKELSSFLTTDLNKTWEVIRGISIIQVAIMGTQPDDESRKVIREMDMASKFQMTSAYYSKRQLDAMNAMAENESGGMPTLLMGMGLGGAMGQHAGQAVQPAPNGYPPQGMPNGYPPQGMPNGYPPQGMPNGYPPQGMPNGYPPQGMPNGYPPQGMPNGYPPQGMPNGYPPQGMPNGYPPQGMPNGYPPQGMPNGYSPQGQAPQNTMPNMNNESNPTPTNPQAGAVGGYENLKKNPNEENDAKDEGNSNDRSSDREV